MATPAPDGVQSTDGVESTDDVESTEIASFDAPCGRVVGTVEGPVIRARAIPYARADRFAAPEPVAPWTVPHLSLIHI